MTRYAYNEFARRVDEATNGEIQFRVYTGGVLLPPRASMEGLADGIAQVGYHAGTYTPDKLPKHNMISELSLVHPDNLVVAIASTELNFVVPELEDEWRSNGVVYGGGYATAPYQLLCNAEVADLSHLQGKRIRMPGGVWDRWAAEMGAVPVNVPSTEIYTGLDRGTLDCGVNPVEGLKSLSFWDVAPHVLDLPLGVYFSGFHWGYDANFWRGLSLEHRRILHENMAWAIAKTAVEFKSETEAVVQEAQARGVTFHPPAAELEEAHLRFVEVDRAGLADLGRSKYNVDDPEKYIEIYLELIEKWERILDDVDVSSVDDIRRVIMSEIYDKIDAENYGL